MKLGIGVSEDLPVTVQQMLAAHIESAGFRSLWTNEATGRDALLLCQAWAAATTDLHVGVGVVPLWTRTPAQLAMGCATLQEASGGRFVLGVGVSHPATMETWHGMTVSRPLTAARELLTILAQIESRQPTDVRGEVLTSRKFTLQLNPPPSRTPRYLAAMGPRMLELAGTMADGVLLNWSSPDEIRHAATIVGAAAEQSGRARSDVEVAAYVRVAVAPDRDRARAALAGQIGRYAALPAYREHFERQGLADAARRANAAHRSGADGQGLAEALGDDALDRLGWAGSPADDPSEMLASYRDAGLDHLIARVVVVGEDPVEDIRSVVARLDPFTTARGSLTP